GDSVVANLFEFLGVRTEFTEEGIQLSKTDYKPDVFDFDFADYPDIAQTVAVVASALRIQMQLNGLHTLYVKETDRVKALKNELKKIGVKADDSTKGSLVISFPEKKEKSPARHQSESMTAGGEDIFDQDLEFKTYNDHRMAMSLA